MNNRYILLWLEAPFQSWGADSKFGRRDTLPFPTRSGILGLLLCAMGASGEQRDLLGRMEPLGQTIISYVRSREGKNGESEKIDREPLLRDFHMVGAGYESDSKKDPWQAMMEPYKSNGTRRTSEGGGIKMTFRYYLQDAKFAVVMEAPAELVETFVQALQNPVYDVYLGRKNCVPTEFIYQGTFDNEDMAINHAAEIMRVKNLMEDFRVLEGEHEGEVMALNDVPLQFGPAKKYRDRRITVVSP
jgi:CRISPR system Cascade subunit CasD